MRLFWLQQLQLIILVQLLDHNKTSHNLFAEALLAHRSSVVGTYQSNVKIGRHPFQHYQSTRIDHKLNDADVVSLLHPNDPHSWQTGSIKLSPLAPTFVSSKEYELGNRKIAAKINENDEVPTLTPLPEADDKKSNKQRNAGIISGVIAAAIVIFIGVLVYVCLMRVKSLIRQTDETVSSASPSVELERGIASYAEALSPFGTQNLRQLMFSELEHATCNFSPTNVIGEGAFGIVYKGLLLDGSIVAIKRRVHNPIQNFSHKVKHIASVHHQHLVKLIGYCEERSQQLLVYEYIFSGNVGNFLYDSEGLPIGKLDMRQRLSIALGTAAGLQHLHNLEPPRLHMHFRTTNVLVSENFTAKVSDYEISMLLMEEGLDGASSSAVDCFLDPELNLSKNFSEQSDVYSFGVFLLELISGRAANTSNQLSSEHNLVSQARSSSFNDFIDKTIGMHASDAAKQLMELALSCLDTSAKRPTMARIVHDIELIQAREIGYLYSEIGEDIGAVKLGSELFK